MRDQGFSAFDTKGQDLYRQIMCKKAWINRSPGKGTNYCRFRNVRENLIANIPEFVASRILSSNIVNTSLLIAILVNGILACEFKNS